MSLPKVLIVGQPFNTIHGGGITLSNLFKGWDKDKIAVDTAVSFAIEHYDSDKVRTEFQHLLLNVSKKDN